MTAAVATDSEAGVHALAGACGGMLALTATYPLMTLSVRQAVRTTGRGQGGGAAGGGVGGGGSGPASGRPGVAAAPPSELFAGIGPALVGTAASQAVYFYVYQSFRHAALSAKAPSPGRAPPSLTKLEALGISMAAGAVNVLITNPIWNVVTRLQTKEKAARGAAEGAAKGGEGAAAPSALGEVRAILDEGGVKALWKGVVPNLIMVSNPAVQFMVYEWLEAELAARAARAGAKQQTRPSALETFSRGAVAKLAATVVTYPIQVVKNRMQAGKKAREAAGAGAGGAGYGNVLEGVSTILKTEGLGGFYKGMNTKLLQSMLASAILFSTKEEMVERVRQVTIALAALQGAKSAALPAAAA